jgi:hypothetical protein
MNLTEFASGAGADGPCVGVNSRTHETLELPAGFELRTVEGERTKTVDALYDAFADVWHFPPWFGRNASAFDDFMRDLDNMIEVSDGKPPAPGYFTHITDAHLILREQPEAFSWFAKCMPFYRNYYRDEANPPAAFGLLLSAPQDQLDEVHQRWVGANVPVASVTT